jgi:hypothetical protein
MWPVSPVSRLENSVVNFVLVQALGCLIAQNDPVKQHRRSGAFGPAGFKHGDSDLCFPTTCGKVQKDRFVPVFESLAQHI